jgi:hypothetical protein
MIDKVSSAIFANNGIHIAITIFARLNMLIQHILIFCQKNKILFSFIYLMSFKNSMCLFRLWEKNEYKDRNKSYIDFTVGIWNKVCISKLVWCAMQWMLSKWKEYLFCIW